MPKNPKKQVDSSPSPKQARYRQVSYTPADQVELMDFIAHLYLRHGLHEKASVLLEARDVLVPNNPKTLIALAIAQIRCNKPEPALFTLERLSVLHPPIPPLLYLAKSQAFQALGRASDAVHAMRLYLVAKKASREESDTDLYQPPEMLAIAKDLQNATQPHSLRTQKPSAKAYGIGTGTAPRIPKSEKGKPKTLPQP